MQRNMHRLQLSAHKARIAVPHILPGPDVPPLAIPANPGEEVVEYDPMDQEAVEDIVVIGPPGSVLEVKHLHEVFNPLTHQYIIKPAPAVETTAEARSDSPVNSKTYHVSTFLQINSPQLIDVGQEVMGQVPGVSWTAKPLRVNPQIFLAWLSELQLHAEKLATKAEAESAAEDSPLRLTLAHLSHLLAYLTQTHEETLATLSSLLAHSEITGDLLWALYIPKKTVLYTLCPATGEPRAVRLAHAELCQVPEQQGVIPAAQDPTGLFIGQQGPDQGMRYLWRLVVEYVEADVVEPGNKETTSIGFGFAGFGAVIDIYSFSGTRKISSLPAYPIQYYAGPGGVEGLKERLVQRGKKWAGIAGGVHHLAYRGIAYQWMQKQYIKHSINSRVMIDRKTFVETAPNYARFPHVSKTLSGEHIDRHAMRSQRSDDSQNTPDKIRNLSDEELLLTTPIVYGFSLSDKQWLEFNIEHVESFQWNDEAFAQLVIPPQNKAVLKTLLESYSSGAASAFDDFISGKGLGLVINLFGNPGTGKSLTAEAMSEELRKPLYVVGAGDLGTTAAAVDTSLTSVFKVAASWGAVCLIDEADVFLEERSLQLLERNAMVAVFLRQLEYFRGILFLTTNRVRVFDEAFQSRIHVSLRYQDLTADARRQIWLAFLRKVNGDLSDGGITQEELRELGEKKVNGRQIKNVVKTAAALAVGRQEKLGFRHLVQVLELMEQFDTSHTMYQ